MRGGEIARWTKRTELRRIDRSSRGCSESPRTRTGPTLRRVFRKFPICVGFIGRSAFDVSLRRVVTSVRILRRLSTPPVVSDMQFSAEGMVTAVVLPSRVDGSSWAQFLAQRRLTAGRAN